MPIFLAIVLQAAAADNQPKLAIPVTDPVTWINTEDYPPEALASSQAGASRVVLTVGVDGRPSSCAVEGPYEILNGATCRLMMERARFIPATNAEGKKTVGTWSRTVRWGAPEKGNNKFDELLANVRRIGSGHSDVIKFIIEKDGSISNCGAFTTEENNQRRDVPGFCDQLSTKKTEPFRDEKGNLVRKQIEMTSSGRATTID